MEGFGARGPSDLAGVAPRKVTGGYFPLTPLHLTVAMTDSSKQRRANQLHRVDIEPVSSNLVLRHPTDPLNQLEPLGIDSMISPYILAMTNSSEQKRANQLHRVGTEYSTEPMSSDLVLRHLTDPLDQLEPLGISTILW